MIYTFGHSTLSHVDAARRLDGIPLLVDVRSHPTSSFAPQWGGDRIDLSRWGVDYLWLPDLGGWSEAVDIDTREVRNAQENGVDVDAYLRGFFPKQRIGRKRTRTSGPLAPTWTNQGLYDYSRYAATGAFRRGVEALLALEREHRHVAIMCAEFLWWKCHRSMVADALAFLGVDVAHLQPEFKRHGTDRLDRYDADVIHQWEQWWR